MDKWERVVDRRDGVWKCHRCWVSTWLDWEGRRVKLVVGCWSNMNWKRVVDWGRRRWMSSICRWRWGCFYQRQSFPISRWWWRWRRWRWRSSISRWRRWWRRWRWRPPIGRWRWSDLPSRFALVRSCSCFCLQGLLLKSNW